MRNFFNNISIRSRLLLSLACFLVTLTYASYNAYVSIGNNIDFSVQERKGNVYQRPLAKILVASGRLRVALAKARVGEKISDYAEDQITAINASMVVLHQAQNDVGVDLQFTDDGLKSRGRDNLKFELVDAKWKDLARQVAANNQADLDAGLASFIADVRGMIGHSGDTSNLILDPDLDSYYLMDITLLALPQTLDRLAVIGSQVYPQMHAGHQITQAEMTEAAVLGRMLSEADVARIDADMDTSLKEDKNFSGVSESYQKNGPVLRDGYDVANKDVITFLQKMAAGETVAAAQFDQAIQKTLDASFSFLDKGYNELDQFLDYRIDGYRHQQTTSVIYSVLGAFISIIFFMVIVRTITKPLTDLTTTMRRLADNQLDTVVDYVEAHSEIGAIAASVQVFKENAVQMEALQVQQERKDREVEQQKKTMISNLADAFETRVADIVHAVASAATQLQTNAEGLERFSAETSQQSTVVAAASEETAVSIQTVASSAEELTASIGAISDQVKDSSKLVSSAVERIKKANETVNSLSSSSAQIGDVLNLIAEIAGQTNLLALNATIEAARAGEAGKGFAVVASEVKNLASQTARATEEIGLRVSSMQAVAGEAGEAIQSIAEIIQSVNGSSGSISSAVTEQAAATQEIARNVQQVSGGTQEVSSSIGTVTHAANESRTASGQVLSAARELSRQSERLKLEVTQFLATVRAS